MSKAEKLAAKILSGRSDQNLSFDDLCHVIECAGFQMRSGKGSHRIYYKDGVVEILMSSHVVAEQSRIRQNRCVRIALKV